MGKGVHTVLENGEVWVEFKSFVMRKHGKINGVLGQEVAKALESYLSTFSKKSSTHTHAAQTSKIRDLIDTARKSWIDRGAPLSTGAFSLEALKADLGRHYNIQDSRSIKSKVRALEMAGVIRTGDYISGVPYVKWTLDEAGPTPIEHMAEMATWYLIHDPNFPRLQERAERSEASDTQPQPTDTQNAT